MKIKVLFFFLLALVNFFSCDSSAPKLDRRPFCIAEPTVRMYNNWLELSTTCADSVETVVYVYEINNIDTYLPDGRGGEWLLQTWQDTTMSPAPQYNTVCYYKKYEDSSYVRVRDVYSNPFLTAQFKAAVKEGR